MLDLRSIGSNPDHCTVECNPHTRASVTSSINLLPAYGNHRSGIALAMCRRQPWYFQLQAHGLGKGKEHPAYAPLEWHTLWNMTHFTFTYYYYYCTFIFRSISLTLLVGWQEGHPACKTGRSFVGDLELCRSYIAPVVTTTSVILSSNKIQNGDVLVPANPDLSGKWPLKRRESTVCG